MKSLLSAVLAVTLFALEPTLGQLYQGPASGSVPSGAATSTDNFPNSPATIDPPGIHNRILVEPLPDPANLPLPAAPEGSNYQKDAAAGALLPPSFPPVTLESFPGIPQTNSIPPDPYLAVGPDHVMQVVNTSFRISDKSGNTLKTIGATQWFANVWPGSGAFDPKVHYDHYSGRWIMVWLQVDDVNQTANYLVSVSDDSNPMGTWYNWALPSNVNGKTASGNWADYQGVGFDQQAIYFTSNQFGFSGGFNYVKVRVMEKSQFYSNTAGPITWKDFWGLRDLNGNGQFTTRPVRSYGHAETGFLVGISPFTTGTYFVLYKIHDPIGSSPSITAAHVPVTSWTSSPNANQLGGGSLLIEGGGSNLRNEPVYMDSTIWAVHSVRSGGSYSSVRYLRFNVTNNSVVEDVAFGAEGFWHFYPAIQVDKDKNLAITFSRSGLTEYAGAYFTWRLDGDPPGLRPSAIIQAGKANYVKDFGSGRNRWGDYMGIALDPVDRNNFWMFTEYAEVPANTWGVWVHNTRLVPYPGSRVLTAPKSLNFGLVEGGTSSDTASIILYNIGETVLEVSSIMTGGSRYQLLNIPTFPASISTYDSITFNVVFRPTDHGVVNDTIIIVSNDTSNQDYRIPMTGKGIVIGRAQAGKMYAVSSALGPGQTGRLYDINLITGQALDIGSTGLLELHGLAIRPSNKEIYAIATSPLNSILYRLSSDSGDALPSRTIPISNMRAITFGSGDTLFAATTSGRLYRIDVQTGDTTFVGTGTGKQYSGLSFSPVTGKLYASVRPPISGRDSIFTINTQTGTTTPVGRTGLGSITPYIAFGPEGTLYGLIGTSTQTNVVYTLDTTNATATLLGSTGIAGLQAIAMRTDSVVVGVWNDPMAGVPTDFYLGQNYPNPFNPTTRIQYALPVASSVLLRIFNVMGQEVIRLVNDRQPAGFYTVDWNGKNAKGVSIPSGVYLYEMEALGSAGKSFTEAKKMLLLK
jgi:hypothetical protein